MRTLLWLIASVLVVASLHAGDAGTHVTVDLTGEDESDLRTALVLSRAHKFDDANAAFLRWIKAHPKDAEAHFSYSYNLYLQAGAEDVKSALAKSLRRKSRALAVKAQKLGCDDAMMHMILESLKEDGSLVRASEFSKRKDVDDLMQSAEAAFAKGDMKVAMQKYEKVLELEPDNYAATLFTGDVYFNQRQIERAVEWFEKAIALNNDVEAAHRYLGDALVRLGRTEDAFTQYVEALVAEPYNRLPRQMLEKIAQSRRMKWRALPSKLPLVTLGTTEKGITMNVGPDFGPLDLLYGAACIKFRSEDFAATFPAEEKSRRSLPEEVSALRAVLAASAEMKDDKSADLAKWPGLATLEAIVKDDLLEAFVLFERVDREIAQDYADYRAAHRDKLLIYVRRYWCGLN